MRLASGEINGGHKKTRKIMQGFMKIILSAGIRIVAPTGVLHPESLLHFSGKKNNAAASEITINNSMNS